MSLSEVRAAMAEAWLVGDQAAYTYWSDVELTRLVRMARVNA